MIASTATDQQITRYLHGWCPQLAGAIREATRWQPDWSLAIATTDDGESGHLVIRTPGGDYLDIRGLHSATELQATYPAAKVIDVDDDWLAERGWDLGYGDEDLAAAQALCTAVGIQLDEEDWEQAERYAL